MHSFFFIALLLFISQSSFADTNHSHGERSHTHSLPVQGVEHRHNRGEMGRIKIKNQSLYSKKNVYEQCLFNFKNRTQKKDSVKLNRDEIYRLLNKNTLDMSGMNIFIEGKNGERGSGFNEIDKLKFIVKNKKLTGAGGAIQHKHFIDSSL